MQCGGEVHRTITENNGGGGGSSGSGSKETD